MNPLVRCFTMLLLAFGVSHVFAAQQRAGVWEVIKDARLTGNKNLSADTFSVTQGDQTYRFKLYFVDTPENDMGRLTLVNQQADYFKIEPNQIIDSGNNAKTFRYKFLKDGFSVTTQWQDARDASGEAQYYAFISDSKGADLAESLVQNGLARIYGVPCTDPWPGGGSPVAFLKRLKQAERQAQQSMRGIWQIAGNEALLFPASAETEFANMTQPTVAFVAEKDRINVNTASITELEALPGIGPAIAARIIAARPIIVVGDLRNISGIGDSLYSQLAPLVKTEEPPPPTKSAELYRSNTEKYLNTQVTVMVQSVSASKSAAPEGFKAVRLDTGPLGSDGGSIIAFIPVAFYDSFIQFYSTPGRDFTGLFYQKDNQTVLVYPRQ